MKRLITAFVGMLTLLAALVVVPNVGANPPGVPAGYKLAYSFNMIGFPAGQEYTGGCGAGHRIFVNRDGVSRIIVRDHDDSWHVADCNATADNTGELHTDELGTYDVYVRILGKPGGQLTVCAEVLADADGLLCELGSFTLNREGGKSQFKVQADSIFDAEYEDILWTVTTNDDYRIAQFRVYKTGS